MELSKRIPLLFNPKAGTLKSMGGRSSLLQAATEYTLLATASADEAEQMARELAEQGHEIVAAAGGDGTLNRVVAGLRGTKAALGVVPGGTMNVFAREMGIAPNNLDAAFRVVREGRICEVDLFEVNGEPFLQMAGYGFDARVIELTGELKDKVGPVAYLAGAIQALGEKPPTITVETAEGETLTGAMVLAGNGGFYGGQVKLFAQAKQNDGLLDVVVFPKLDAGVIWEVASGLFKGGIKSNSRHVRYRQTESVKMTSDRDLPLELDGEYVGSMSEVEILPADERLRVVEPQGGEMEEFDD